MTKTKISMNVNSDESGSAVFVSEKKLTAAMLGCLQALERLSGPGVFIEAIKIRFTSFPLAGSREKEYGPSFAVYFFGPLGDKDTYGTDFRFIEDGTPNPTANQIAESLTNGFQEYLRRNLGDVREKLDKTTSWLGESDPE